MLLEGARLPKERAQEQRTCSGLRLRSVLGVRNGIPLRTGGFYNVGAGTGTISPAEGSGMKEQVATETDTLKKKGAGTAQDQGLPDLTPSQERAVLCLASGMTKVEAARRCRRGRQTIHEWLHEPVFADALARQRAVFAQEVIDAIQVPTLQGVRESLNFLRDSLADPGCTGQDAVRVSRALLSFGAKMLAAPLAKMAPASGNRPTGTTR